MKQTIKRISLSETMHVHQIYIIGDCRSNKSNEQWYVLEVPIL